MEIEISRVYMLILIPVVLLLMYLTLKKLDNIMRKDKLVLISRVMIFILLIIGICDISINIKGQSTSTVFLLDVSESMSSFKNEGVKFINNALSEMPKDNAAGVVVFGDNAAVDKFMNEGKEYSQIKNEPVVNATNIEEAVNSAFSLFSKGAGKRIVLITDGEENQGDLLNNVPLLSRENVELKVYKVENAVGDEVYVDDVKVPENISIGEDFSVVVKIESNVKTKAKISLFCGRDKKGEQDVEIQSGSNSFVFKDVQNTGGLKSYRALIEPEDDTNKSNNEYSTFTNVISKPKILVVEGSSGSGRGVIESLNAAGSDFSTVSVQGAPQGLNEMIEYKSIVLCDVHADDLSRGFMDNIEAYVKDYGNGLVTFGGEDSYALGNYKDTALEKVLPVNMDKKGKNQIPKISMSLVIDKSGSMSGGNGEVSKLTLAKEAAMKSLDNLRDDDEINVIAFDDGYQDVVPRQNLANKDEIKSLIAGISEGGGTSIYPALSESLKSQLKSDAKIKHIILLTDGQDGFGLSNYYDLLDEMKENNITLSTVSVGDDADTSLLETLADEGQGRKYHTDRYTDIPRIFAKEVMLSAGTYIINEEFVPKEVSSHEILNSVLDDAGMPSLLGYVGTSLKENAIEILASNHDEPILASMQCGLGRTVSWTSDINGQWSSNLLTWNKGAQLIKNAIYWTVPDLNDSGKLSIKQSGNEAVIEFYDDSLKSGAKIKGVYNGEKEETGEFELTQDEPGKFTGRVKLGNPGFYTFNIREEEDGEAVNNYTGAFSLQYSDEYKFNKNKDKIESMVEQVKGIFINKPKEVFDSEVKGDYKVINLTSVSLILAMIIFLLDIAYRRFNLNFEKHIEKFTNKFIKKAALGVSSLKNKISSNNVNDHENITILKKDKIIRNEISARNEMIGGTDGRDRKDRADGTYRTTEKIIDEAKTDYISKNKEKVSSYMKIAKQADYGKNNSVKNNEDNVDKSMAGKSDNKDNVDKGKHRKIENKDKKNNQSSKGRLDTASLLKNMKKR